MQTFVPYPDFRASAVVLDSRRLGKQRVETFQILRALIWPTYGWKNHPATRMWRGFVPALVCYGLATCDEWERRGHADGTRASLLEFHGGSAPLFEELLATGQVPPWWGHDALHRSHQSALVRKDPAYYRAYFPEVPDDLPYFWPSAAFPRWPLRRGHNEALTTEEALALLGLPAITPQQQAAVDAARAGRHLHLALPAGAGATTAGLLAGLCTPGSTLWVTPGQPPAPVVLPRMPDHPVAAGGKVSESIARPADAATAAVMAAEASAEPEFRFLRPDAVTEQSAAGASLIVLDHGVPDVADVGLPVLRLETLPAEPGTDPLTVLGLRPAKRARKPKPDVVLPKPRRRAISAKGA
jgi:hypothetical protein